MRDTFARSPIRAKCKCTIWTVRFLPNTRSQATSWRPPQHSTTQQITSNQSINRQLSLSTWQQLLWETARVWPTNSSNNNSWPTRKSCANVLNSCWATKISTRNWWTFWHATASIQPDIECLFGNCCSNCPKTTIPIRRWYRKAFIWSLLICIRNTRSKVRNATDCCKGSCDWNNSKTIFIATCGSICFSVFRTLSVLANWAPILADCEYLPLLIFPFVKLFQNNHVTCFEIIVTFLSESFWRPRI